MAARPSWHSPSACTMRCCSIWDCPANRASKCGRGAHTCLAQEARRGFDPQCSRCGLDGGEAGHPSSNVVRSIRRKLLVWLLLGIALAVAAAAVGTYWRARDEANALFDYQLKEMAASLTDAPFAAVPAGAGTIGAGSDAMVVQIWDRNGVQLFLSQPRRVLPH